MNVRFADDMMIIANGTKILQTVILKMEKRFKDMKIDTSKTNIIRINDTIIVKVKTNEEKSRARC